MYEIAVSSRRAVKFRNEEFPGPKLFYCTKCADVDVK